MGRDAHEHELFRRAFNPPDAEPYDVAQPVNADEPVGGFTEEVRDVQADPRVIMALRAGPRPLGCPHAVSCLAVEECRQRGARTL